MSRSIFPVPSTGMAPKLTVNAVVMTPVRRDDGDELVMLGGGQDSIAALDADPSKSRQNYVDRVRNYIPIEVIGFFVFVNSLVGETLRTDAGIAIDGYVALAAVGIGALATVLYVRASANSENNPVWGLQAIISILAFLVWIYALDAKALAVFGWDVVPSLSGLMLASFTVMSGLIVPTVKRPETEPRDTPND